MSTPDVALPTPRTAAGRDGLAAVVADPRHALLALDFDGTLSPIVDDPATSRLADGALPVLRRLARAVGRVAIVTGRQAGVVVRLAGLEDVPGLVVAGQYGAEQWYDGRLHTPDPPASIAALRRELPDVVAQAGPGPWIEDKVLALVVHTRTAPDPYGALARLTGPLRALADRLGLEMLTGRLALELREPGLDKGAALRALVARDGSRAVLYAGDDVGDLPAFTAVADLRAVGHPGVTVCSGSDEAPTVAAAADVVVDGPAGVVGFLAALAERVAGDCG